MHNNCLFMTNANELLSFRFFLPKKQICQHSIAAGQKQTLISHLLQKKIHKKQKTFLLKNDENYVLYFEKRKT